MRSTYIAARRQFSTPWTPVGHQTAARREGAEMGRSRGGGADSLRNNRITLCHGEYVLSALHEPINVILY